jgi:hypothetical protein
MASARHPRLFFIALSAHNQFLSVAPFQFSSELFILFSSHYEPFPIYPIWFSPEIVNVLNILVRLFHPLATLLSTGEPWRVTKKSQENLLDDLQNLLQRLLAS